MVRPFFPEVNVEAICGRSQADESLDETEVRTAHQLKLSIISQELVNLSWPYILISAAHILPAVGFFLIGGFRNLFLLILELNL